MSEEDIADKVNQQLIDLQNQVKQNIVQQEKRGVSLTALNEQTEGLKEQTGLFQTNAKEVKRKMYWKYFKWVFLAVLLISILGLIVFKLFWPK